MLVQPLLVATPKLNLYESEELKTVVRPLVIFM